MPGEVNGIDVEGAAEAPLKGDHHGGIVDIAQQLSRAHEPTSHDPERDQTALSASRMSSVSTSGNSRPAARIICGNRE